MATKLKEDRAFVLTNEPAVARLIKLIGDLALPFRVMLTRELALRSNEQNARLWALHTLAGEHTGYTPGEMHEEALCKYFGYTERKRRDLFTGEMVIKRVPNKRSSKRNKREFNAFMESTEEWYATDFGVSLE